MGALFTGVRGRGALWSWSYAKRYSSNGESENPWLVDTRSLIACVALRSEVAER
jgi:hypothetical protein